MREHTIPQATAKRLPLYYRFLENLRATGKQRVSSSELSEAVKVDAATIRRDFSCFGALGKKGYGYNVNYLLEFFRETLRQDDKTAVILVGVGNLGTALLHYNFQKTHNIEIVRAYDVDPSKIGEEISGVHIYDLNEIEREPLGDCVVAVLTVPVQAAQKTSDLLVKAGIQGILNFTPARLDVPPHIRVHHIDLSIELQSLIYFLKHYPLNKEKAGGE
ncbi:redox-sensing transcriptional repressor Rex [Caldalkalibacillus mannanilyticus]|uniref:redox-sensing transcriptional repressor Rex n=1 Tax=Caldalkalibacillus mannanilyticus TaxID=1418 RepID=UPI0004680377|nr:redox-sensing transcriptional repressor Rex [Caldalkalibacillus mannanilyticus]